MSRSKRFWGDEKRRKNEGQTYVPEDNKRVHGKSGVWKCNYWNIPLGLPCHDECPKSSEMKRELQHIERMKTRELLKRELDDLYTEP